MNILLVNTRHFGGGGESTYTFNLAVVLREQGHDVSFFAMQDGRNLHEENEDLFVDHVDFRDLNNNRTFKGGIQVLSRVIYSRENRKRFSLLLDRFQPDIVHLQNIHGHISPSIIYEAKSRGLPVIWTLHDYKLVCPNTHFLIDATGEICEACEERSYYHAALKRCKKRSLLASIMASIEAYSHRIMRITDMVNFFHAPSLFLKKKFVERGFDSERVKHIPYFLPDEMFKSPNGNDEGYILFMARLEALKGVYSLIDACRRCRKVKVILAGRMEDNLKDSLNSILPENAEYVGMKHGKELGSLLSGARAVVVPSLWYENQPFTILEAFAAGKPVIASNLGGMTELVKHGERGLLVPPGNIEALTNALNWMAEHGQEAREMGRIANTYVLREHNVRKNYERLMKIYERCLN